MQAATADLSCCECNSEFTQASELLKHFVSHINEKSGGDSGIDSEDVNPIRFCLVTMEEEAANSKKHDEETNEANREKKFQCLYCRKRFGWSTDLKRHILIHTGEKPFGCSDCSEAYTRKFLLEKHRSKVHGKLKYLPDLKPISSSKVKKQKLSENGHDTFIQCKIDVICSN